MRCDLDHIYWPTALSKQPPQLRYSRTQPDPGTIKRRCQCATTPLGHSRSAIEKAEPRWERDHLVDGEPATTQELLVLLQVPLPCSDDPPRKLRHHPIERGTGLRMAAEVGEERFPKGNFEGWLTRSYCVRARAMPCRPPLQHASPHRAAIRQHPNPARRPFPSPRFDDLIPQPVPDPGAHA